MKNGNTKRRGQLPEISHRARAVAPRRSTVGELISAAYEVLGDTRQVMRLLGSGALSRRMGRKLVFI